jgi:hypothetical protein
MKAEYQITEPFLFNLLKHHLGYMKDFIDDMLASLPDFPIAPLNYQLMLNCPPAPLKGGVIRKSLTHIGSTVMDVYHGSLSAKTICEEISDYLKNHNLTDFEKYSGWTGRNPESFRIIALSDESEWTLKFNNDHNRYVHIFPARNSRYTFRVKGNTLKSALIYIILIGKDMVTGKDLNKVRPYLGLSPVKDAIDAEAIVEMIEILRR